MNTLVSLPAARRLGIAGVLAAALVAPLPASAGAPFGDHPRGPGGDLFRLEHMMAELDLSEAQRAAVERITADSRAAMQPLVKELVAGRRALRDLIDAEVLDEAALRALAGEQNAARTEMLVLRARARHAVNQLLTAEQRERLADRRGHHGRAPR